MKFAGEPSPVQEMHWHNVNAGSHHSWPKDANAKMSTSKSQTTRYDVVNEIERSNSEYQDVRVYAMKSIRLMYVHRLPIDNHSMYVRQQDAELTSTNTHHNAQKNQKKLLALCVACHHTAKTYKHKYKLVLCQHRVYATPTHFTRIDGKATPLFTHLTYSLPDTRASSSTFTQPPSFLENDRPTIPQCRLRLSKLECKCKWKAHRNQSVSGNLQVVMECNDNGRRICSLGVDQYVSTANADITKQACTMYHQTNISVL